MALLLAGYEDWGLLVLRVFLGLIFVYHGWPKFTMGMKAAGKMAKGIGIPAGLFLLIGLGEFLFGIAAILGVWTQIAGIYFAILILGALYLKLSKWNAPFSSMKGTGWEFDLLILGAALVLLFNGAGGISVDAVIGLWP